MATMNVCLPDPMKVWVDTRIGTGRYASSARTSWQLCKQPSQKSWKAALLKTLICRNYSEIWMRHDALPDQPGRTGRLTGHWPQHTR